MHTGVTVCCLLDTLWAAVAVAEEDTLVSAKLARLAMLEGAVEEANMFLACEGGTLC